MMRIKQFVYQYEEYALFRLPLARWQRIISSEEPEPGFCDRTVHIIYAYVEMQNKKPIFCHRIEAVRYTFGADGYYCPTPLPDFDLLSGVREEKVSYLATRKARQQYFSEHYWQPSPLLVDSLLEKIWQDSRLTLL